MESAAPGPSAPLHCRSRLPRCPLRRLDSSYSSLQLLPLPSPTPSSAARCSAALRALEQPSGSSDSGAGFPCKPEQPVSRAARRQGRPRRPAPRGTAGLPAPLCSGTRGPQRAAAGRRCCTWKEAAPGLGAAGPAAVRPPWVRPSDHQGRRRASGVGPLCCTPPQPCSSKSALNAVPTSPRDQTQALLASPPEGSLCLGHGHDALRTFTLHPCLSLLLVPSGIHLAYPHAHVFVSPGDPIQGGGSASRQSHSRRGPSEVTRRVLPSVDPGCPAEPWCGCYRAEQGKVGHGTGK